MRMPRAMTREAPMARLADSASVEAAAQVLAELAARGRTLLCPPGESRIAIGMATCGQAAGARDLARKFRARRDLDGTAIVADAGCLGVCFAEPLVDVRRPDGMHYFFGRADQSYWRILQTAMRSTASGYPWAVARERTPGALRRIGDLEIVEARNSGFAQFLSAQERRVSARGGLIDPGSIAEYVAADGSLGAGTWKRCRERCQYSPPPRYLKTDVLAWKKAY